MVASGEYLNVYLVTQGGHLRDSLGGTTGGKLFQEVGGSKGVLW